MADLIISQPMTFTVDVKTGLVERPQRESLMRGDKHANRIIVELVDGSRPFDITGVTVKGEFCKPPNGDAINLPGEAKSNVAEVQLTDQCYTAGGHYEARVILVLGEVERTVLFISGDVLKSGSGNAAGDEPGSTGSGLPAGGTAGQVLVKVSSAQGDAIWKTLTASDVGAATKEEVNQLSQQMADYRTAENLLHNSNFAEFVAQAGIGKEHEVDEIYAGDRWILESGTVSATANSNGKGYNNVKLNGTIYQKVENAPSVATAAIEMVSGTADIRYENGIVKITSAGGVLKWADLYEGEYTDKTRPPYVPKGYVAELAECQRYYYRINGPDYADVLVCIGASNTSEIYAPIILPTQLRGTGWPTVTYENVNVYAYMAGQSFTVSSITLSGMSASRNALAICIDHEEFLPEAQPSGLRIYPGGHLAFSMDL